MPNPVYEVHDSKYGGVDILYKNEINIARGVPECDVMKYVDMHRAGALDMSEWAPFPGEVLVESVPFAVNPGPIPAAPHSNSEFDEISDFRFISDDSEHSDNSDSSDESEFSNVPECFDNSESSDDPEFSADLEQAKWEALLSHSGM